jgi:hypothetical protein
MAGPAHAPVTDPLQALGPLGAMPEDTFGDAVASVCSGEQCCTSALSHGKPQEPLSGWHDVRERSRLGAFAGSGREGHVALFYLAHTVPVIS